MKSGSFSASSLPAWMNSTRRATLAAIVLHVDEDMSVIMVRSCYSLNHRPPRRNMADTPILCLKDI